MKDIKDKEFEEFHKSNLFIFKKDYVKAENFLRLGLKKAQKEKMSPKISFYLSALGHLYILQDKYLEALSFYEHSDKVNNDYNTKLIYARLLISVYRNFDLALDKVNEAIESIPPKGQALNQAYSLMGLCYLKKGDKVNASKAFYKSLKVDFDQMKSSNSYDLTLVSELIKAGIYNRKVDSYLRYVSEKALEENNVRLQKILKKLITCKT